MSAEEDTPIRPGNWCRGELRRRSIRREAWLPRREDQHVEIEGRWPRAAMVPWRSVTANTYVSYRAIRRWLTEEIAMTPMDPLCALLLRTLHRSGGGAARSNLADALALPQSTMSGAIRRLERAGFAEQSRDPTDLRCRYVELTRAGASTARSVTRGIDAIEHDVESSAGPAGRKGFNLMANLLAAIEVEPDPWG